MGYARRAELRGGKAMNDIKKYEFCPSELSERAYAVYINSSFTFYKSNQGIYYCADNQSSTEIDEVGSLADVEEFLTTI